MIKKLVLALSFSLLSIQTAHAATTCRLGIDKGTEVKIVKSSKIYDTHLYFFQIAGKGKVPLFGDKDHSRGAYVQIDCVGTKHHALVISGEFTANALQGVMFTYNPTNHKIDRMEFAEKSRPSLVYLGDTSNLLIVQTNGNGDSDKKYSIYQTSANAEATTEYLDNLPSATGFDVQPIRK